MHNMMQAPNAKKAVKVSYQGETKRLKLSGAYQELIERTISAFSSSLPSDFKFFYLDEDNEIISISSQSDYTEALESQDFSALRLTVAQTAAEARQQLLTQLEEARPLAESLNSSQIMSVKNHGFGRTSTIDRDQFMAESDFDAISHQELAQSIVERRHTMQEPVSARVKHDMAIGPDAMPTQSHEIAVGNDQVMTESVSIGTGNMANATNEAGCNTARVQSKNVMINTCVETQDMSSQARTQMCDTGCDGIITEMHNQTTQMEVEVKDMDVTCDLLIPSDEDEAGLEEVTCIKCNGTQMNKKGLPCRKCNGTGTLVSRELSAMASMVRQEVQEYCYESFKKMFTEYLNDKRVQQNKFEHTGVACDGCDANPIVGIRYKCSVRHDTDFCQKCEKNGTAGTYPLLKIRDSTQAPVKLICQYGNPNQSRQQMPNNMVDIMQAQMQAQMQPQKAAEETKKARYSARFVKESFPDKYEIECGKFFSKSFWMRNDGEIAWPVGTQLLQTSGDDISAKVFTAKTEVAPGETQEIAVACKAPQQEGRYCAFFRLQTGKIKFGHKVGCDVICVKPQEEAPVVEHGLARSMMKPVVAQAPVQMVAQEAVAADKEVEMADEQPAQEAAQPKPEDEKPSALMQSMISIGEKGPKEIYYEKVDSLADETLKEALKSLYEFGFTNFVLNKMLMEKHRDVNIVAEQLMTGALSESQFASVAEDADLYD